MSAYCVVEGMMKLPSNWGDLRIPAAWAAAVIIGSLGGYAYLHNTFASRGDMIVVQVKADVALEKHMDRLLKEINFLEGKQKKTADDRQHLQYLREELQRLRNIKK